MAADGDQLFPRRRQKQNAAAPLQAVVHWPRPEPSTGFRVETDDLQAGFPERVERMPAAAVHRLGRLDEKHAAAAQCDGRVQNRPAVMRPFALAKPPTVERRGEQVRASHHRLVVVVVGADQAAAWLRARRGRALCRAENALGRQHRVPPVPPLPRHERRHGKRPLHFTAGKVDQPRLVRHRHAEPAGVHRHVAGVVRHRVTLRAGQRQPPQLGAVVGVHRDHEILAGDDQLALRGERRGRAQMPVHHRSRAGAAEPLQHKIAVYD